MSKPKQNDIAGSHHKKSILHEQEEEILKLASGQLNFKPTKLLGRSSWWGSKTVGAVHYEGVWKNKPAILKIQGVKPEASEIYLIKSFNKNNRSKIIRPPHLYAYKEWDDRNNFEALVLEKLTGKKVVNIPTTNSELNKFFSLRNEYRKNCYREPWLAYPDEDLTKFIRFRFASIQKSSEKIYPKHPLRKTSDNELIKKIIQVVIKGYKGVKLEFQHGHFSHNDLYQSGRDVILLSNLFWGWRPPFYDSIFAYHWAQYHTAGLENYNKLEFRKQKQLWQERIDKIPKNKREKVLLKLVLLYMAGAGLVIDGLTVDTKRPLAKIAMEDTRQDIQQLLEELHYES